jgi:hypothetical protein
MAAGDRPRFDKGRPQSDLHLLHLLLNRGRALEQALACKAITGHKGSKSRNGQIMGFVISTIEHSLLSRIELFTTGPDDPRNVIFVFVSTVEAGQKVSVTARVILELVRLRVG